MATLPKVLGIILDPKLTCNTHIHNISVQTHKLQQMTKALTATGLGKHETLMTTYKAVMRPALEYASSIWCCCCCLPTHPCLHGGVLPYFEVTGHPVPVPSQGFKCPDCFICNCSYIVYPSKMKGPFRDNCLIYYYL